MITGEEVLKRFAYLAVIYTTFVGGSVQMRMERLNYRQWEVVQTVIEVQRLPGLGGSPGPAGAPNQRANGAGKDTTPGGRNTF